MPDLMKFYCKIPYTNVTGTFNIYPDATMSVFVLFVNTSVREYFNISSESKIEIVEVKEQCLNGPNELEPSLEITEQTFEERYGHVYRKNNIMAFYIRVAN